MNWFSGKYDMLKEFLNNVTKKLTVIYSSPAAKQAITFGVMALVIVIGRTFDPFWYDEYKMPDSLLQQLD